MLVSEVQGPHLLGDPWDGCMMFWKAGRAPHKETKNPKKSCPYILWKCLVCSVTLWFSRNISIIVFWCAIKQKKALIIIIIMNQQLRRINSQFLLFSSSMFSVECFLLVFFPCSSHSYAIPVPHARSSEYLWNVWISVWWSRGTFRLTSLASGHCVRSPAVGLSGHTFASQADATHISYIFRHSHGCPPIGWYDESQSSCQIAWVIDTCVSPSCVSFTGEERRLWWSMGQTERGPAVWDRRCVKGRLMHPPGSSPLPERQRGKTAGHDWLAPQRVPKSCRTYNKGNLINTLLKEWHQLFVNFIEQVSSEGLSYI